LHVGTSAKTLLRTFLTSSTPGPELLSELLAKHQTPATTTGELEALCREAVEALPKEAEKVRQGQGKVVMRLVGEVMKRSGGKVDAKKAGEVLRGFLGV
jgi:aspartyl-tRNA(Asn)/glutamyl-tRNA(Gln) amidotransferase subunit B